MPLDYAQQFVLAEGSGGGAISTPEAVVRAGSHMAAVELAAEPGVRQEARSQFKVRRWGRWCSAAGMVGHGEAGWWGVHVSSDPHLTVLALLTPHPHTHPVLLQRRALVTTEPTAAGEAGLDPFHPLGAVKRLHRKPLHEFEGSDQFLRLVQAEKEGLVRRRSPCCCCLLPCHHATPLLL